MPRVVCLLRCLAIVLSAVGLIAVAGPAASHAAPGSATVVVLVPLKSYPRNALVRVVVRLSNGTSAPLKVAPPTGCLIRSVWARVVSEQDTVVYPPALKGASAPPCPKDTSEATPTLLPRERLDVAQYVVLRGSRIVGRANLAQGGRRFTVRSAPVVVTLLPSTAPKLVLSPGQAPEFATLAPGVGRPFYQSQTICGPSDNEEVDQTLHWVQSKTVRIHPDCAFPKSWRIIAGDIGRPVGEILWKQG